MAKIDIKLSLTHEEQINLIVMKYSLEMIKMKKDMQDKEYDYQISVLNNKMSDLLNSISNRLSISFSEWEVDALNNTFRKIDNGGNNCNGTI